MKKEKFYEYGKKEWFKGAIQFLILDIILSLLFYDSIIPAFLFLPTCWTYERIRRIGKIRKQKEKAEQQFLEAMRGVGNALLAGYSIENAITEGWKELKKIYGEKEKMVQEFRILKAQIELNQTVEKLFYHLAKKTEIESIEDFAEVFSAAKRTGGNLAEIIQKTNQWILEKNETKREIQTCVAGKKTEQRIMSLMPCGMIGYVAFTSPGFLDSMYHNMLGIMVMSVCLFIYIGAFLIGKKVVEIEV